MKGTEVVEQTGGGRRVEFLDDVTRGRAPGNVGGGLEELKRGERVRREYVADTRLKSTSVREYSKIFSSSRFLSICFQGSRGRRRARGRGMRVQAKILTAQFARLRALFSSPFLALCM